MSDISVHQSDGLWKKNPIEVYYIGNIQIIQYILKLKNIPPGEHGAIYKATQNIKNTNI